MDAPCSLPAHAGFYQKVRRAVVGQCAQWTIHRGASANKRKIIRCAQLKTSRHFLQRVRSEEKKHKPFKSLLWTLVYGIVLLYMHYS